MLTKIPATRFVLLILLQLLISTSSYAQQGVFGYHFEMDNGYPKVTAVAPGMPASKAGLRVGDWILSVDGRSLAGMNTNQVVQAVAGSVGESSRFVINRGGQDYSFSMTRTYPNQSSRTNKPGSFGITYEIVNGYPKVTAVTPGSAAAAAGLLAGDWLISFNGRALAGMTANQAGQLMKGDAGVAGDFVIQRGGEQYSVTIVRGFAGAAPTHQAPPKTARDTTRHLRESARGVPSDPQEFLRAIERNSR